MQNSILNNMQPKIQSDDEREPEHSGSSSQIPLGSAHGSQQVQKYEKGTNRIGASRLQQISHILQIPVAFFFEGAPKLHGSTDRMKDAPSLSYVSEFLATPGRPLADKGFHADQRTQAYAPHRRSR